jgi:hypothetical protein
MGVVDIRKKPIEKGVFVRYNGAGTAGKVLDIVPFALLDEIDENSKIAIDNQDNFWIKIDKTNLWYVSDTLEVLNEEDIKKPRFEKFENDEKEDIENFKEDLGDIDLESTDCIGGG